ncbi:MAG: hypothetical protein C5B50_06515 [Verrucomicrobia bacterium]|nr:MAG: hypothetical protein C5B50_06515 [Verrucomicrobiota bacterium]
MRPKSVMLIAGEASGDLLAAELVQALRRELTGVEAIPTTDYQPLHASLEPRFCGAGGPKMAGGGVDLAFDLTTHAVVGFTDVIKKFPFFRRAFRRLVHLAIEREPDVIICVDFGGFNLRFARAIRSYVASRNDWFHDWQPKIVQYVSPQVWASREGRAYQIAQDYDLLLSIVPFEKEWYSRRVPKLRVEFVGHPLVDRYGRGGDLKGLKRLNELNGLNKLNAKAPDGAASVLLLPGSRSGEVRRHVPILLEAAQKIAAARQTVFRMVLPNEQLVQQAARAMASRPIGMASPGQPVANEVARIIHESPRIEVQVGGLESALRQADIAITKSGTITSECALFGVPAVVFYKTSPMTYFLGRRLVKVEHLALPNLLTSLGKSEPVEPVFPEFIQGAATPENIARATLELLEDPGRRDRVKSRLGEIAASLGPSGATERAANAIVRLLEPEAVLQTAVPEPAGMRRE